MNITTICRPGDVVTILTPQNQHRKGRVVMCNPSSNCAVLNMGGRYGIPGIADENNILIVKRGHTVIYTS